MARAELRMVNCESKRALAPKKGGFLRSHTRRAVADRNSQYIVHQLVLIRMTGIVVDIS
jgi:hypothetical protein